MNANGQGVRPGPGFTTEQWLRVSECFLRRRDLEDCRKWALQAQASDPGNAAAAQILAVADVLAANRRDCYAILGINRYSDDSKLLSDRFTKLNVLLNPNRNKLPFAREALDLVENAWELLANPMKKSQLDTALKSSESHSQVRTKRRKGFGAKKEGQCGSGGDNFWTMCPYCYYVYEYHRGFQDCCLRCQNDKCGRGFHAVAIPKPPPAAVVDSGRYWCSGFYPVGFEGGEGKGKETSWTPFGPMFMGTPRPEEKAEEKNADGDGSNRDCFVEISDDSDSSGDELMGKGKETLGTAKKVKTEEVKKGDESIHGCGTSTGQGNAPSVVKPVMKMKKSVAWNTRKIMGKGIKVRRDETMGGNAKELGGDADTSEDDEDWGSSFAGGMEMGSSGGVSGVGTVQFF